MMDRQSRNLMSLPKGQLIPVILVHRDDARRDDARRDDARRDGHMAGQKTENAHKSQRQ